MNYNIVKDLKTIDGAVTWLPSVIKEFPVYLPIGFSLITRPPLNEVLKYRDKKKRNQAMYIARLQYAYTLKEIAEYLGIHYTTVSKVVKRIEEKEKM